MKKKMMVLTGLLMAVVVTAYSVSGTYAKYTSTFTGTSSATVAKWAFTINNAKPNADGTFTFDLFNTINDSNGQAETDVAKGTDGANLIAPGVSGEFSIAIANQSEVTAKVTMDATVNNQFTATDGTVYTIPVEFSIGKTDTNGDVIWSTDLNTVLASFSDTLAFNSGATNPTPVIKWRWAFNDNNAAQSAIDTKLGIAAAEAAAMGDRPAVTVTLNVHADQVD